MDWIISHDKKVGSRQANSLPFSWLPSLRPKILAAALSITFFRDCIQSRKQWSSAFSRGGKTFLERCSLTTHWAELGHRAPPKPPTGKEQDYLGWFRTSVIHSLGLSTLLQHQPMVSATASVCPLSAPGSSEGGGVKPKMYLCTYNCPSANSLPPGNYLVGQSGWERVTKHCFNLSHILHHQWYLHTRVPFIPSECEAFGTQKPIDDSASLFQVLIPSLS